MAKLLVLSLSISALEVFVLFISTAAAGGDGLSWILIDKAETCQSSGAECMADSADEFHMNWESVRRMLATTTKYISYGALQANRVPCSCRGASYYNCRPGAQANPYTRSCSAATRCRS